MARKRLLSATGVVLIILAGSVSAQSTDSPPPPAADQRSPEELEAKLQERDRLMRRVRQLRAEGQLDEAVTVAEQILAIEREVYGAVHEEVAGTLQLLAGLHEQAGQWEAARQRRREVLEIYRKLYASPDHPKRWRVTDARLALEDAERLARMSADERERLKVADALEVEASQLARIGRQREAIERLQKVLAIRRELLGERHPNYGRALNNLAARYFITGDQRRALQLLEQATQIAKESFGERHPNYAAALHNLARAYSAMGLYAQAIPLVQQSLAITEATVGKHSVGYVRGLQNLAGLYMELSDYARAEPVQLRALELCRQVLGKRHPAYVEILNNIGSMYMSMRHHERAKPFFQEALQLTMDVFGENHPWYGPILVNVADLYRENGQYAYAETLLKQALRWQEERLGKNHPIYATTLYYLAVLYVQMGEAARAKEHLTSALEIRRRVLGEKHPDYAATLNGLAALAFAVGDFDRAEELFRRTLAIERMVYGERHARFATTLGNLAVVYSRRGEYSKARDLLEKVAEIERERLGRHHPTYASTLGNLARVYFALEDYDRAERLYREALQIEAAALGEHHPSFASTLRALGYFLAARNRLPEARDAFVKAARAYASTVAREVAASTQARHSGLAGRWRHHLYEALTLADVGESYEEILELVLDWKAPSARALRARREALVRASDPEIRQLHRRVLAERATLAAVLMRGPKPGESPEEFQARRKLHEERLERAEAELTARLPTYATLQRAERAGTAELASQLGDDAALIEFVHYQPFRYDRERKLADWVSPRYAAIILRRQGGRPNVRYVQLGEAAPIDQAIVRWRRAVQAGGLDSQAERTLVERLWRPLYEALGPDIRTLHLSPDGTLALLPLEALRPDGRSYLIERYQVSYVAHGRELMPEPELARRNPVALVVADPDYNSSDGTREEPPLKLLAQATPSGFRAFDGLRFRRLPGFAREAETVVHNFRAKGIPVRLLSGPAATEEAVAAIRRPRFLYFVTHGFFLPDMLPSVTLGGPGQRGIELVAQPGADQPKPDQPNGLGAPELRSGLALAGANRWQERLAAGLTDGLLTAMDVGGLDLTGTELVVLSACETGVGEVQIGEGVIGLRRAFRMAGARTVVASLWKVPDRETERLMGRFVQLWLEGKRPAPALRQAQLELIAALRAEQDARRRSAPPLYWAAFITHGHP